MDRVVAVSLAGLILAAVCLAEGPAFDAASVKVSPADAPRPYTIGGGPGTRDSGRFRAAHTNMGFLLQKAYGLQRDQIVAPSWVKDLPPSVYYEIAVTMPPETGKEQFQTMLQNLLAERFHVAVHHEIRHFPGYELVVDKGGPKMKEVTLDDDVPDGPQMRQPRGPDGFPMIAGPVTIDMSNMTDHQRMKFQQRTMGDFAGLLGNMIARSHGLQLQMGDPRPRVIDMTGLKGSYTFTLDYACDACAPLDSAQDGAGTAASEPGSGFPVLFKAVQQQLGLRLEKKADVSLDVIVVDRVDKTPTAN